jgi:protein disulfide-isomerase A1
MIKQSLPAVSTATQENLEELKTMDKIVIIAYLSSEDKTSNQTFTTVAESQRDSYLFAGSNDAALAKTEDTKQPSIVLYKDFDEKKSVFDGDFDEETITNWIKTASTPLVGEVGPETYSGYMSVCVLYKQHPPPHI